MKNSAFSENPSFEQPKMGSDRSFGILFAVVFVLIGLWPLASGGETRIWPFAPAALFLASVVFAPRLLRPLNQLWFRFGLILGKLVTPVVLGILFYFTVTPVAFLMRFLGKDVLRLKRDPTIATYWLPRTPPGPERGSMRDQF